MRRQLRPGQALSGAASHSRRVYLALPLLLWPAYSACRETTSSPLGGEAQKDALLAQGSATEPGLSVKNRSAHELRVISLSPGLTETMAELGAAAQLVGVSDYCVAPGGRELPRVGSALTPNYEAIARLAPDLIVATQVAGDQLKPLQKLARTVSLPWLELEQVLTSIRELGSVIGREPQALQLAARMASALSQEPEPAAPRVLWVLDLGDMGQNVSWFIRDNSLHGALLRAAGVRNAVPQPVQGPPTLSAEQLLAVDPDAIVMVLASDTLSAKQLQAAQDRALAHYSRWTPLKAIAHQRVKVLHHPHAMDLGPAALELIPRLHLEFEQMFGRPLRTVATGRAQGALP